MLGGDSDNPMDVFQKLMSGDVQWVKLCTIYTTVTQKWNSEIDQQAMVSQAQSMYRDNGDNPMFQAMNQQMKPVNHNQTNTLFLKIKPKLDFKRIKSKTNPSYKTRK